MRPKVTLEILPKYKIRVLLTKTVKCDAFQSENQDTNIFKTELGKITMNSKTQF